MTKTLLGRVAGVLLNWMAAFFGAPSMVLADHERPATTSIRWRNRMFGGETIEGAIDRTEVVTVHGAGQEEGRHRAG